MQNYLPTDYQNFIALSRYARWNEEQQRREVWSETVSRYFNYMYKHLDENYNYKVDPLLVDQLENAVLGLEVMPSMRAIMTSGEELGFL